MQTKQFTLGGYPYTAPERIGSGIIARVNERMHKQYAKEHPNAIGDTDAYAAWFAANSNGYFYATCIMLAMLTRDRDARGNQSPPVLQAYDEAEDAEVEAIVGFFIEKVIARYEKPIESATTSSDTDGDATTAVKTSAPRTKRTPKSTPA